MHIINPGPEDYHTHSLVFSDGFNTIDELAYFAGKFGLDRIAITDHSQACLDKAGIQKKTYRIIAERWKNVHNDVEVIFGVEGDLLDESGNICDNIQGIAPEFMILSAHPGVYSSDKSTITRGYINAIKKHSKKIKFIGHPCSKYFSESVDIREVIKAANDHGVALEINGSNLVNGNTDMKKLDILLATADCAYINSDAHTLNELRDSRKRVFEYLKEKGIWF
jgi:histidinol phosphatase-like PHP family hydrolase